MVSTCTECGGTGRIRCETCAGSGTSGTWQWPGGGETAAPCAACHGAGVFSCPSCQGTRAAPEPRRPPSAPQLGTPVCWTKSAPAAECAAVGFVWSSYAEAELDGHAWKVILVGDAVPFYRLLVDGEVVVELERDHWPACWTWRT